MLGNVLTKLVSGEYTAGHHKVLFDASQLSSGIYFYSLRAGDFRCVKRLMLLK